MRIIRTWSLLSGLITLLLASGIAMAADFAVVVANDFVHGNVSPDGSVVVGASASAGVQVFRWENGTLDFIITNPGPASGAAASQSGSVVVGFLELSGSQAYRWQGGTETSIPYLPGGSWNEARDITADASVIVGSSLSTAAGGNKEAFRVEGLSLLGLGDLVGGSFESIATAINPGADVIVGLGTSASGVEAARWDNLVMSGLGDFAGGAFESVAFDVSNDGSVVVGYGTTTAGEQAFRWEDSVMQPLGDLGSGTSRAQSVSGDGSIVVGRSGIDAFIWDSFYGMRDLEQILTLNGVDLQGIELRDAMSISHDGETIVGVGFDDVSILSVVWIATGLTPEFLGAPASVPAAAWPMTAVMLMALLSVGAMRLRRSS